MFDHTQDFIRDVSYLANEAADKARGILPKLDSFKDVKRALVDRENFMISSKDSEAVAGPIFTGTLEDQRRYSDEELRTRWGLNDRQVGQYNSFMDAVSLSLDQTVAADVLRYIGDAATPEFRAMALKQREAFRSELTRFLADDANAKDKALAEARKEYKRAMSNFYAWQKRKLDGVKGGLTLAIEQEIEDRKAEVQGQYKPLVEAAEQAHSDAVDLEREVRQKYERLDQLKAEGYAPLMRFGKYVVHIKDKAGQTLFWSLYESKAAANKAARELSADPDFAEAEVIQDILSQKQYELYASMPLDSIELFAKAVDAEQSDVYKEFIKVARNNRSTLKRLLKRNGTAGFSEDVPRVLAAFITGNARAASSQTHLPQAQKIADEIRAGDVQDEAIDLIKAVQDPGDKAGFVRGLMFTNFIGGSIASAAINLTQPLTMTLPFLSQYGGARRAARRLMIAGRLVVSGKADGELKDALERAERDGVVSPQEIHHLIAQASGSIGDKTLLKVFNFVWGAPFGLAEQFNRRVTFLAAYQTALDEKMDDPFAFAENAVNETQGLYNKGNSANLARNAIGASVLTFKQFSVHYIEWILRMAKNGPEGRKAALLALTMIALTAGVEGLPFMEDISDLVDTVGQAMGYDTNSKRWRRQLLTDALGEDLATVVSRGITSIPGWPFDASLRMGMSNLSPGTGLFLRSNTDTAGQLLEIAGPAGGLFKQFMEAGKKALAGNITDAGFAAAPVAIQNLYKAYVMADKGYATDALDRKVMDTDATDAFMRSIGFNPQKLAAESERIGAIRRSEQLADNVEGDIVARIASAIVDGDKDMEREARQEIADWNSKNPGQPIRVTPQQIRQKVLKMKQDRQTRFIKSVAPERRAAVAEAIQ